MTTAKTRVLIGLAALIMAAYLTLFTVKDYGLWIALGGSLVSAGLVKSIGKGKDV